MSPWSRFTGDCRCIRLVASSATIASVTFGTKIIWVLVKFSLVVWLIREVLYTASFNVDAAIREPRLRKFGDFWLEVLTTFTWLLPSGLLAFEDLLGPAHGFGHFCDRRSALTILMKTVMQVCFCPLSKAVRKLRLRSIVFWNGASKHLRYFLNYGAFKWHVCLLLTHALRFLLLLSKDTRCEINFITAVIGRNLSTLKDF